MENKMDGEREEKVELPRQEPLPQSSPAAPSLLSLPTQPQVTTDNRPSPREELQRLYQQGVISEEELKQMEMADRRFHACETRPDTEEDETPEVPIPKAPSCTHSTEEAPPAEMVKQTTPSHDLLVPFPQSKGETSSDNTTSRTTASTEIPQQSSSQASTKEKGTTVSSSSQQQQNPLDYVRKGAVAVAGGTMVGVGLVMIPLPTPFGAAIAGGGMAVLGTEFDQVRENNTKILNTMIQGIESLDNDPDNLQSNSCAIEEKEETKPEAPTKTLAQLAVKSKKAVSSFLCENVLPFLRSTRGEYTQAMSEHDDDDGDDDGIREIKLLEAQGLVQVKQLPSTTTKTKQEEQ